MLLWLQESGSTTFGGPHPNRCKLLPRRSKDLDFCRKFGSGQLANRACFLACLQTLLLFKRQARTYVQAGAAQRVMEFELRRLRVEIHSDSLLSARPGRNFWCPDDDDWHEGPDPSEVNLRRPSCVLRLPCDTFRFRGFRSCSLSAFVMACSIRVVLAALEWHGTT